MPAYFDSGFCVRKPSWHRQELLLDDYPTDWDDARLKAGLLWEPVARPVYAQVKGGIDPVFEPIEGFRQIVRDDNGATLTVTTDSYQLISHAVMGEILEAILGETNVKFETAGSVKGGAQVWALVRLDEPYTIPGDTTATYPYLVLLNSHDGSAACKVINTSIRVVCWNTFQASDMEGERTGRQFTFRHTKKVLNRIEDARTALKGLKAEQNQWIELAKELSLLPISGVQFNHFLSEFIPEPEAGVVSDRVLANVEKGREIFRSLYFDSPTTEGIRGTGYGLVQAAGEYLDHARGFRNSDTYLGRTLLRPEPLKAKAVKLVREVAKV